MKTLTRYILSEFAKPFGVATLAFCAIILVVQIFNDMGMILNHKPGFLMAAQYFGLLVPGFLMQAIPLAVLFGVLFSLSRFAKNSELIAMRSGGGTIFLAAVPLLFAGVAIGLLSVAFNEFVVPRASETARTVKAVGIEKRPARSDHQPLRNLSLVGEEGQVYHIGLFDGAKGSMKDVMILEFAEGIRIKSRLDAKGAEFRDGRWFFLDGYLRVFGDGGEEISAKSFTELALSLAETPKDFMREQKEPADMNFAELAAYVRQLKRGGHNTHKEMVALHHKLALPFGCVILALLGVPWGWSMGKYSGVVMSFGICLLIAFIYLGGMQIGQGLGNSGVIPPFFAMWSVNLVFAILGPALLVAKNR